MLQIQINNLENKGIVFLGESNYLTHSREMSNAGVANL